MSAGAPRETARPALEVAVSTPAGARAAVAGGADRVELCSALELGGLTPSQGLVEAVVEVGLPVQVLIRSRPGDFVVDDDEVRLMERELRAAVSSGAAGVVIGALTEAGALDLDVVDRLARAARHARDDVEVTVHRAIDQSADPVAAAASLAGRGIDRILSSGGAARAGDGVAVLRRMAAEPGAPTVMAGGGVRVGDVAGGGVRVGDVAEFLRAGITAVHVSAKRAAPRRGGAWIPLGAGVSGEGADTHFVTDQGIVEAVRVALDI
ncbi:copper homeostasis protein [Frondihabitans sp. PhB188]|uniref:copper homeostasis protein CutC n=1 Tax=Frondihabitans sp. PhB188 TaxID=2485200 RepID=UPI000F4849D0|nr:copper homeostasis protein CutC [Frondihabitans sp. PhB188]ROQ41514.1 copper homeostasis protein [Frondihabitans sp. PhB188]